MHQKTATHNNDDKLLDLFVIQVFGYFVLLVVFGVFGVWSFWAPIDSAAHAMGVVSVKSNRRTIQHLEGGIVQRIMVKEGDNVELGDTLVVLDETQIKAQLEIIRGQLIALTAIEARLQAERDNHNNIRFPLLLSNLDDQRIDDARKGQEQIFKARRNSFLGEIDVLQQRVSQLQSKRQGLNRLRNSNRRLLLSFQEEIGDLEELLSEGFADQQRIRELRRNHEKTRGEIDKYTSEIATTNIQIGETRLQILQLTKQFQEDVVKQLGEVQTNLYDIRERDIALQDKIARTRIKAPADGVVLGLKVHTINAVIAPGEAVMDIVPQREELIVTAHVSPLDIDRVYVGLTAEVRFSSFKSALTPVLFGNVITLSADSLMNEQTRETYYQAQVALTEASNERLGGLQLLPGMPAEVLINTGERTLFEYLTQPVTNAFARAFIED